MARARSIKPGFFKNDVLCELPAFARLLFAGLWTLADREGRLEDRPGRIRAEIFPYEMKTDVDKLLTMLTEAKLVLRYEIGGKKYLAIPTWHKHQSPHHMESPSEIPPPDGMANKMNCTPISPKQRARIYVRDGHRCSFCGSKKDLQLDHIIEVRNGGSSADDNLRTLCGQCNNGRSKRCAPLGETESNPSSSLTPSSLTPDSLNPESSMDARTPPDALDQAASPKVSTGNRDPFLAWQTDEGFLRLKAAYEARGACPGGDALSESDWGDAFRFWRALDFEQRLAAVQGIEARTDQEPQYFKKPAKYLQAPGSFGYTPKAPRRDDMAARVEQARMRNRGMV